MMTILICYIVIGVVFYTTLRYTIEIMGEDVIRALNFELDVYDFKVRVAMFLICIVLWPLFVFKIL